MKCFDELLAPFDTQRFFREHWGRTPLLIRGKADKFAGLPGLKELPSVMAGKLSAERWSAGFTGLTEASFVDQHGKLREFNATPAMWSGLYNAGVSLCFGPMTQLSEKLTALVEAFKRSTPSPGRIKTTCYLTPPSSGSPMHFDRQNVFFLQVAGEKHWKYGRRAALEDAPLFMQAAWLDIPDVKALGIASPSETGLDETVLRPGDVLYLPQGAWHEGHTENSHSLHYTLTFDPHTPMNLVSAFLRQEMLRNPTLRRDLRYSVESGGRPPLELVEAALRDLREALARVTPTDLFRSLDETNQATTEMLQLFFSQF